MTVTAWVPSALQPSQPTLKTQRLVATRRAHEAAFKSCSGLAAPQVTLHSLRWKSPQRPRQGENHPTARNLGHCLPLGVKGGPEIKKHRFAAWIQRSPGDIRWQGKGRWGLKSLILRLCWFLFCWDNTVASDERTATTPQGDWAAQARPSSCGLWGRAHFHRGTLGFTNSSKAFNFPQRQVSEVYFF